MFLSRTCEYAVRVLAALAELPDGTCAPVTDLARSACAPAPATGKVLQQLARHGFVRSSRGRGGGFRLARDPATISLHNIFSAINGPEALSRCAVGFGDCSETTPCPLHEHWNPVRQQMCRYLEQTSLADMTSAVRRKKQVASTADDDGRPLATSSVLGRPRR